MQYSPQFFSADGSVAVANFNLYSLQQFKKTPDINYATDSSGSFTCIMTSETEVFTFTAQNKKSARAGCAAQALKYYSMIVPEHQGESPWTRVKRLFDCTLTAVGVMDTIQVTLTIGGRTFIASADSFELARDKAALTVLFEREQFLNQ